MNYLGRPKLCICGARIDDFSTTKICIHAEEYGPHIPHDMARGSHEIYSGRHGLHRLKCDGSIEWCANYAGQHKYI